ncbi:MAG TPA: MmgE/PrpD family protein [Tepidisphaeraceae bacterium]|jgi:2-methylcitrate dehydratase
MVETLAERMSEYAMGLRYEDLPPVVVHEVKRRVLDSLGCALGAWESEPAGVARRVTSTLSADRGATVIGTSHRAPPDWVAFANGCMVRYLDYNDTYLSKEPAHPSDNIPAALAVAQSVGSTGRELIAAIVIAYEVQCRLCDATSLRAIGWDHVTYGAFSSALAAARLMRLDVHRTRHAVNIAGVRSAALRQSRVGELSHWKGCAFADEARHGVFAAMLAREGMTGPAPIFEGEKGFEKLVSGPLVPVGPFGESPTPAAGDCMICKTSIKCWPVEYHAQSAVDAALQLRQQIGARDAIVSVDIESHDAAVDIIGSEPEKWAPRTRETADHSLPYIVAAALADGEITDRQFAPERFRDPKLLDLVQKVKVHRHAELSAAYPGAVGNIVTITLRDGRRLTRRVDHACGHARNPMSDELVERKFHTMADPRLGRERADRVVQWAWNLDKVDRVDDVFPLLEVRA